MPSQRVFLRPTGTRFLSGLRRVNLPVGLMNFRPVYPGPVLIFIFATATTIIASAVTRNCRLSKTMCRRRVFPPTTTASRCGRRPINRKRRAGRARRGPRGSS